MERREFFKAVASLAAAPVALKLLSSNAFAAEQRRGGSAGANAGGDQCKMVQPGVGQAASLNYTDDKAKVKDAKLKVERQGTAWDQQFCHNCMLFSDPTKCGGKEAGQCQLFLATKEKVSHHGWCASWSKKA
jgi:hypothetical protein